MEKVTQTTTTTAEERHDEELNAQAKGTITCIHHSKPWSAPGRKPGGPVGSASPATIRPRW